MGRDDYFSDRFPDPLAARDYWPAAPKPSPVPFPLTRYHRSVDGRVPCFPVKLKGGIETLTPSQWEEIRAAYIVGRDKPEGFDRAFCEGLGPIVERATEEVILEALNDGRDLAATLFGEGARVQLDGRGGGWLVVLGLPPLEYWDSGMDEAGDPIAERLPFLGIGWELEDGTELGGSASVLDRWRYFTAAAARTVEEIPFNVAALLALNHYPPHSLERFLIQSRDETSWRLETLEIVEKAQGFQEACTRASELATRLGHALFVQELLPDDTDGIRVVVEPKVKQ